MENPKLAVPLLCLLAGLNACATDVNRSLCEGFQARARVVDPLADPKTARDQTTCEAYQAERARLQKERPE
jgi:hypothetical protein